MKNTLFILFTLAAVWIHAADRPNILFCSALAILMHVQKKRVAASVLEQAWGGGVEWWA